MTDELLPCPFCGETPEPPIDATRILGVWRIVHRGCPVLRNFAVERSEKAEAIAAWNTRAQDTRIAAAEAAMAEKAAALAESAMRCRSCGAVFAASDLHTDETCPKNHADWESAEPDEVADAILALITSDAQTALDQVIAEAVKRERDRCAQALLDSIPADAHPDSHIVWVLQDRAAAIRERKDA